MKKFFIFLVCVSLLLPAGDILAMGGKSGASKAASNAVSKVNELGNNDALQEAGGRAGEGFANIGSNQVNQAWNYTDSTGNLTKPAQQMANNGVRIFATGKAIEYGSKAAPHVGWVATSAGRAYEGDYSGAAVDGANGLGRTLTVAKIGTAAGTAGGIWVAGKLGAVAGSWAGPLGAGAGFIIGCGAAYVGGKIWDKTVGKGADALDQKIQDWKAEGKYGISVDQRQAITTSRDAVRGATSGAVRDAIRSGSGGGSSGSRPGGCTCPCPR